MRTPPDMLKLIADGPIFLLEDVDGDIVGNSQALALDLTEATRLIEDMVTAITQNDVAILRTKMMKWLRLV